MLDSTRLSEQKFAIEREKGELETKLRTPRYTFLTGNEDDFQARQGEIAAMYEQIGERSSKVVALNTQIVEATDREEQEGTIATAARVVDEAALTPELRELREVAQRVGIADYLMAARDGRPVTGAGAEYNQHVFGHNAAGDVPVEILADREDMIAYGAREWKDIKESEFRASLTGTGVNPGASTSYVSQLFAMSEGAFCGASFPAVGVGDHSAIRFSARARREATSPATQRNPPRQGPWTINTATNRRLQWSTEINTEDENRIPNIAGGLVGHMRMGIMEILDDYVITQLRSGLTAPAASTTTETLSLFLARVGGIIDGFAARNVGDVRGLLNSVPETAGGVSVMSLLSGSSLASGGSHFWELPRLSDPLYFRGSAHLPAVTSGDLGDAIFIKTGMGVNLNRLIVPIWRRASMLRGTSVGQRRARITYTVAMFSAVELTATDQHEQRRLLVA